MFHNAEEGSALEVVLAADALPARSVATTPAPSGHGTAGEVFRVALRLGLTSFGGPVAHLGYFRTEYVTRRRWLDEAAFADLVALCQFLPGPASSQVGIGVGVIRAGWAGGLAAWLGFTLPSAAALTAFAYGVDRFDLSTAGWLHGLKVVAVAVVAQAVWGMARRFCTGPWLATIGVLAALIVLAVPGSVGQLGVIAGAGLLGWRLFPGAPDDTGRRAALPARKRFAIAPWLAFFGLLGGLPVARLSFPGGLLALFDSFYRTGALVFGGGHVVLPLLQAEVVPSGWVTTGQFLAGYGAAQAVPGPLFTFAAYLGAVRAPAPNGVGGAIIALIGIFLPSFLLMAGAMPFWNILRARPAFAGALRGVNAAVVGILLAALYSPVWTTAVTGPSDVALALAGLSLLQLWKLPPWAVVIFSAVVGAALGVPR